MQHLRGRRGLVTKPATVPFVLLLLALGVFSPLAGCASDQNEGSGVEQVGSLGLNLEVAPGVSLLSVTYAITGNGFTKSGVIDVGNSPTISGTIGGIPGGSGYTLELSATSVEDETVFTGSAHFDVVAGQTTAVTVHLTGTASTGTGGAKGSVSVNGTINVGPVIDEFTVTPLTVFVDSEVTLTAVAHDPDGEPSALSYAWSASEGGIGSSTEPTATLTSATPGTVAVTLIVSDGELTSERTTSVTFVDRGDDESSGGAPATGGATGSGGTGGVLSTGGVPNTGGVPGTGGVANAGGEASSGGDTGAGGAADTGGSAGSGGETGGGGTGGEEQGAFALVTTAVAPNTAGVTSTVLPIPAGVEPGDIAVVFVLSTGSSTVVGSPEGFVTTALAAAQHNLSYGPVGSQTSLTWTSSATATTGATAFFFRGASIAVQVLGTSQPSGNTFGLAASTQAPGAAFVSGYALFGIQLAASSTPTVTAAPAAPWVGPVSDGKQLFTWGQPYVPSPDGFLFPSSLGGTLSASSTKRQAQVFVSSPE